MKAITVHNFGGPEVLNYEEVPVPEIGPDEALIKVHSCGVKPHRLEGTPGNLQGTGPL